MSQRFIDSFAHYNNSSVYRKWTTTTPVTWFGSGGRRNAPYLEVQQGGPSGIFRTLTPTATWVLGAAMYMPSQIGNNVQLLSIGNGAGNNLAGFGKNTDETLSLFMGNNYTSYRIATSVTSINPSQWNYFEVMLTLSGGTGVLSLAGTLKVNGNVVLTGSGVGQGQTGAQQLFQGNYANTVGVFGPIDGFQDFYALDTISTDINGFTTTNTGFWGDVQIISLFPDADITTNMSTFGGDGTHAYSCVDATAPTDDTNYVFSSNTGSSEAFTYQPISGFVGSILGAQYLGCLKKDAEGLRTAALTVHGTQVSSINYATTTGSNTSTTQYLADYYNYFIAPLDSAEGTAWTPTVFNTTTFGITLTT